MPEKIFGFNGTVNSITFRFEMEVNPPPNSENFAVYHFERKVTKLESVIRILKVNGANHSIEINFNTKTGGPIVIGFKDLVTPISFNTSRLTLISKQAHMHVVLYLRI